MEKLNDHPLLSPTHFFLNSMYLVTLAVIGTLIVETLKLLRDGEAEWVNYGLFTALLAVMACLWGMHISKLLREGLTESKERLTVLGIGNPPPRVQGLILLVSIGPGSSSALQAAEYHGKRGELTDIWLISSKQGESNIKEISEKLKAQFPTLKNVHDKYLPNIFDVEAAKSLVEEIRKDAINRFKIPEARLMCDFTGMNTQVSAGMVLACASSAAKLQFQRPNQIDNDGRAVPAAGSSPVAVELAYRVIREGEE